MVKVKAFKAKKDLYIIFKDDLEEYDMLVASADELACYAREGEVFAWVPEDGSYYSESGANLGEHWFENESNWEAIEMYKVEETVA